LIKSDDQTELFSCTLSSSVYLLIIGWYLFLVFGFLTLLCMIIFGIQSIGN